MASGRELIAALKESAGAGAPLVILVERPPLAVLRPVASRADRLDPDDVRRLTQWRNRHVSAFLTEFEATEARTARWLAETVHQDEGKILFMVDDPEGRSFAYMGLACIDWRRSAGEADAIVRGEPAPPGAMAAALRTLLEWARGPLGLNDISVRVRSDNPRAVGFYERVGFREVCRRPLRRHQEGGTTRWVEVGDAERAGIALVVMRYVPPARECHEESLGRPGK